MFGRVYATSDRLPSLQECGRARLYDDAPGVRTSTELRRLNTLVLGLFRDLLGALSTPAVTGAPPPHCALISRIEDVFINMHHLLNTLRPVQAARDLRMLVERQTQGRLAATRALLDSANAADDAIASASDALIQGKPAELRDRDVQEQKLHTASEARAVAVINEQLKLAKEFQVGSKNISSKSGPIVSWYHPQLKTPSAVVIDVPQPPPTPTRAASTAAVPKFDTLFDDATLDHVQRIVNDQAL
jgi:hypothetical protein